MKINGLNLGDVLLGMITMMISSSCTYCKKFQFIIIIIIIIMLSPSLSTCKESLVKSFRLLMLNLSFQHRLLSLSRASAFSRKNPTLLQRKSNSPVAMTNHGRSNTSFGNFLAGTANYSVACSWDPLAEMYY